MNNKRRNIARANRPLADGYTVSNNMDITHLNNNDLIIGPSGAGKTGGYIIPNLIEADESLIVADTKGNLCTNYGEILQKKGYKIYVIDFVNPARSDAYNPFDYIRRYPDGNPCEMDIVSVANTIVPIETVNDPFWENSAQHVLQCLIAFTLDNFEPEDQNLYTVNKLYKLALEQASSGNGIQFLDEYCIKNPKSYTARKYKLFRSVTFVDRTWNCITQFLSNRISVFDLEDTKHIFGTRNKLYFPDIGKEKSAVFLNISDNDRAFDKLITLFYNQALQSLIKTADNNPDQCLEVPVRLMLDDFATNVKIFNFDQIVSVIRSRYISTSIILQSLSQLNSLYSPAQADTIINNCDHILYLGGADLKTVEYISQRTNKSSQSIMQMPLDKVFLLERGKNGQLLDKIKPYSYQPRKETPSKPKENIIDEYPF